MTSPTDNRTVVWCRGEELDRRWYSALLGLRVTAAGRLGEVTGFEHEGYAVWVVLDGEERPQRFAWEEVRPA